MCDLHRRAAVRAAVRPRLDDLERTGRHRFRIARRRTRTRPVGLHRRAQGGHRADRTARPVGGWQPVVRRAAVRGTRGIAADRRVGWRRCDHGQPPALYGSQVAWSHALGRRAGVRGPGRPGVGAAHRPGRRAVVAAVRGAARRVGAAGRWALSRPDHRPVAGCRRRGGTAGGRRLLGASRQQRVVSAQLPQPDSAVAAGDRADRGRVRRLRLRPAVRQLRWTAGCRHRRHRARLCRIGTWRGSRGPTTTSCEVRFGACTHARF